MAIPLTSTSFKVTLAVTGLLSILATVAMNSSFPSLPHVVARYFPIIYDFAVLVLTPPYLYLVINCIIICIVVSSKLQKYPSPDGDPRFPREAAAVIPVPSDVPAYLTAEYIAGYNGSVESNILDDAPLHQMGKVPQRSPDVITEKTDIAGDKDRRETEKVIPVSDSVFSVSKVAEKPPASARFSQRKAAKANPEVAGGNRTTALGVSKPKRQETLETTWKKITEGRSMPLTRHLKKSETWERHGSHGQQRDERATKSDNMDEGNTAGDMRQLKREPSPGQEELNRRVEAFIKKFNEEMKLQRMESLSKYQEMMVGT